MPVFKSSLVVGVLALARNGVLCQIINDGIRAGAACIDTESDQRDQSFLLMMSFFYNIKYMMPGSKGLNPHELAHRWVKGPWDPPRYEHKSGIYIPRYANIGQDCGSAQHGTIRRHHSWGLLPPTSSIYVKRKCVWKYLRNYVKFPMIGTIKRMQGRLPEKEPEDRTCVLEDIVKRWRGGTDLAVLACESQARIHYAMPVRNMLYDSLTYTEQIRQVWKLHENKRDKGNREAVDTAENEDNKITEEEYLSRFRKTDSIVPVLTLVFYYDLKQWDGAQDLYGMFGLNMQTEEGRILCKYVPNYRINLVDVGNISDLGMFHTDLQQILGVLKYRQDKKELKDYIYENRDYFAGVDVETYQALRAFLHSENMLKGLCSFR